MNIRRKIFTAAAALALIAGAATWMADPALAAGESQVCSSNNVCITAASGGPYIVTGIYNGGAWGDFAIQPLYGRCNSSDLTTANCPYSGVAAGHLVFQIRFNGATSWNGWCLGDEHNSPYYADTSMATCNNPGTGYGGGYGTVFYSDNAGCSAGVAGYDSFHWTYGELSADVSGYGNEYWENSSTGICMKQSAQFGVG